MTRRARLKGVAASIGVAVGPARVIGRERRRFSHRRIEESAVPSELARFEQAVEKSRTEIEAAKRELAQQHGSSYAAILDVHLLMHGDALLIDSIYEAIRNDGINAEWALSRVTEELKKPLLESPSAYFRERAEDIEHVGQHLLRHLRGGQRRESPPDEPTVVIAHDLTPADAVHALAPPTVGLVTEMGAASSHTAILARTFGVPAVVGVGPLPKIDDDEVVLVNGFSGEVTVGATLEERREAGMRRDRFTSLLMAERATKAVTREGIPISVAANVELSSELHAVLESGADGIGLYRTEFMCLGQAEPPSEDAQVELYREVVHAIIPKRVVFRTFDWRGDKRLDAHDLHDRERIWLKTQLKALLRACRAQSIALMFPMVATLEELFFVKGLVDECRSELGNEIAGSAQLSVGMMVEVPSAALLADRFAEHVDFFAVGTNDLAHYTLGLDRHHGRPLADPLDPSVLTLLERVITVASDAGVPCSVCGDMVADPMALALVLGFGCREISVPVSVVPLARAVIRRIDLEVAAKAARDALEERSAEAVRALVAERLGATLGALWKEPRFV